MPPATKSVPSLPRILDAGVPPEALAFYGRWWQLESWLRELVYVELRAKYGAGWTAHLKGRAPKRAAGDEGNTYMASADSGEMLSYADVSDLFSLIEAHWELFKPFLPPLLRWQGRTDELRELRNRNAHCRRPHRDDLNRIEQALRDLENGAWLFYGSYGKTRAVTRKSRDPVVRSWVAGKHDTAARLLDHAARQYETQFRLTYSIRPWAIAPEPDTISGSEGVVWHASWVLAGRELNVAELWSDLARMPVTSDLIVHLLVDPGSVTATFAAVDEPEQIADAIGTTFDLILTDSHASRHFESAEDWAAHWSRGIDLLPRRVQTQSAFALVDPYLPTPFSLFGST